MLRRVPPGEACGGVMGFSPWGSTLWGDVEGVKALIEFAKLSLSRYDERRKYEWRVSVAF